MKKINIIAKSSNRCSSTTVADSFLKAAMKRGVSASSEGGGKYSK